MGTSAPGRRHDRCHAEAVVPATFLSATGPESLPHSTQGGAAAARRVGRRARWNHRVLWPRVQTKPNRSARRGSGWIPGAVLLITFFVAAILSPTRGSRSFYETTGQVIPVIMLTLAIEARAFEWTVEWRGWQDRWRRGLDGWMVEALARIAVLVGLIVAEMITLAELTGAGPWRVPNPSTCSGRWRPASRLSWSSRFRVANASQRRGANPPTASPKGSRLCF